MADLLIKYDLDKYGWRPLSSADGAPEGRIRYLYGPEDSQDVLNRFNKGEQTLFFATYVELSIPVLESKLLQASRDAWLWLRYSIPAIASSVGADEMGNSTLTYKAATVDSANEWADRTLVLSRQESIDLDEFRRRVGPNIVPSSAGDQTWLYLVFGDSDTEESISKLGFLLHTHHAPFDGTAVKIIMNRYLTKLAKLLRASDGERDILEWGKEVHNLTPPVSQILVPTEPRPVPLDSPEKPSMDMPYYSILGLLVQRLVESFQNAHGFKPRPSDPHWPSPHRVEVVFTKEESERVLAALKHPDPDRKYTVTHLAHAALAMTLIADNPPTAEAASRAMYNLSLANCRNRLVPPYDTREEYSGYALGILMMKVPVSTFLSDDGEPLPLNKATLSKAMTVVRDLYKAEKASPTRMSYLGQVGDIFRAMITQAVAANMLSPNNGYFFSSDGMGENYLDTTFHDGAGKPALTVTKYFTSLNHTDPGPFFRIASWNRVLDINADFNSNLVSVEDANRYMNTWKEFMLLVLEFDDEDY